MTALRPLLTGLLDYAGLFPPAALSMEDAVRLYAAYRRSRFAWALGRFVVPVARLAEFSHTARAWLPSEGSAVPWRLSALVGPDAAHDLGEVMAFNHRHGQSSDGWARVDAVELRPVDSDAVDAMGRLFEGYGVAFEVAATDEGLHQVLRAVKSGGGTAKLRTGGVTADAIPGVDGVSAFLWASARVEVPIKLTAGLHHAVRGEYALTYETDAPRSALHGLLNVLVAAMAARRLARRAEDGASTVAAILGTTDARVFSVRSDGIAWRDLWFPSEEVSATRAAFAISVGSCSFEEPLDELMALAPGIDVALEGPSS